MNSDVVLARNAASGDVKDREKVTRLVNELVVEKTEKYCKEFCFENRSLYACTLDASWGCQSIDAALCEWGNGSIVWMLDDLTNDNRLNKFEGRSNSGLINYLSKIAGSFQFRERWKDWRFRRRIRVPDYIKVLDNDACKVFWKLCDQDSVPNIAQVLGRELAEIEVVVKQIFAELHARKKLHKLNLAQLVSLTGLGVGDDPDMQFDLPAGGAGGEDQLFQDQIKAAFSRLSWKEQFILEVMVIDQLDVASVLTALSEQGISIKKGVPPEETSANQVYYFRNKALSKLKEKFCLGRGAFPGL